MKIQRGKSYGKKPFWHRPLRKPGDGAVKILIFSGSGGGPVLVVAGPVLYNKENRDWSRFAGTVLAKKV